MPINDDDYISPKIFKIYSREFEEFFINNSLVDKTYSPGDKIELVNTADVVGYLHSGVAKIYNINRNGDEMFYGYLPQYSTMLHSPSANSVGKYMIAASTVKIYYCLYQKYMDFLARDPQRISHALSESYYRHNLKDLPRSESMGQTSQFKVYNFIFYVAKYFGTPSIKNKEAIVVTCPPTYHDIAYFNDIHPNNASKYLSELKKANLIQYQKGRLIINSITKLSEEVRNLKK